ncbi:MAG: ATP-binding protein [Taibaiella sp.]|jgi:signal transduction histidine kinase
MNIRLKLTLGVGLLFFFIVLLSLIGVLQINNLANDTRNILRANYNTLDYSRQMFTALDKFKTDNSALTEFSANLEKQKDNVTEKGEQEATDRLSSHFVMLRQHTQDSLLPDLIRKDINDIMHLNMGAISRKSQVAEKTAKDAVRWITATGTVCFVIALLLLLNLPGNIADPVKELTQSIGAIAAGNYNRRVNFRSGSELATLSMAFNTMAEKLEEYHNSKISELLMEKKRIDTLINNMQDPVIGLDEQNKILFANNVALQITGLKKEQVIGKTAQDIAIHNDLMRLLIKDLVPPPIDLEPAHKSEPIKIYAGNKESYFDKETVKISIVPTGERETQDIGYVIILKNITLFKELDTAKTNFIATVSHELKTPISAIKLSIQLLTKKGADTLNEEQLQLLESIEDDANRLLKITGELLNMTQVETGNIQLNIKKNRPEEMVQYAVDAVSFLAERKKINLVTDIATSLPEVNADADKTAWVLVNFLTNAIRYSPEGSTIKVLVRPKEDKISFSVTDSGTGIDERYLGKIFDRYFQVPGSAKTGTGLGLAISKEFIEAQNGTIGVESKVGSGSCFYFML